MQHHVSEGDLNVFGTADMHLVEAFFLTMGFYGALLAFWTWMVSGHEIGSSSFELWVPLRPAACQQVEQGACNLAGHSLRMSHTDVYKFT